MKVYFVSLGCPKNLTDTEVMMGQFASAGYRITTRPREADTIVVNTCAFLKTARDEALATIKEMAEWKQKGNCKQLLIAGCLPKYLNSSFVIRHSSLSQVDGLLDSVTLPSYCVPRIKATPPWTAYVKISEGCNNRCTYCLIPSLRGPLRHRPAADVVREAEALARRGVKEIVLIAQDTTAHPDLAEILRKTARLNGLRWVRLMYAHPAHLTDQVIKVIAAERKIVKYLDLPIQHAGDKILKLMNRRYTRQELEALISKIRREIPKIALRTAVIAGFPGEGEAEFGELLDFIRKVKFDRLGCFIFQPENGTPASKMKGRVSGPVKIRRAKRLMRAQALVSRELNKNLIGQNVEIIIEGAVRGGFVGRSRRDAPEIDGRVFIKSAHHLTPGKIVKARLTGAGTYDLFAGVT
ncbi:MAG: 30S ribosomal protein S12 methylthiotransferase RimO [Candidatus Saganbacteria bacterium]|nr:30S ribosomal protein S12 methylthiotransferase RimO [Candidatus Saganbacteria bacterium]